MSGPRSEYWDLVRASLRRLGRTPEMPRDWVPADGLRLFFFVQTYRDVARLRRALAILRRSYPVTAVLVVSDGDPDPSIEHVCHEYGAACDRRTQRLIAVEYGGEVVQDMLDRFLRTDAEILIKIDPDTDMRRRFRFMPDPAARGVYGTVQWAGDGPQRLFSIQGGCIVIPRQAALSLSESGLLLSARLKPPSLVWVRNRKSARRAASGLTSYDWSLGWACQQLHLDIGSHPEVFSRYRPSVVDSLTDNRMAISHPRFEWTQVLDHRFYFPGIRGELARDRDGAMPG